MHLHTLREAATDVARLISILEHPHEQPWLEKMIKAWAFDAVPPEFLELVQKEMHEPWSFWTYYLVFLNFLPSRCGSTQDVASHDIDVIETAVSVEWRIYLSLPKMALRMDDKVAISRLLTGQMDGVEHAL